MRRACPLCATSNGRTVLERPPWRLLECAGCGLAYLPEYPSEERLDAEFDWDESFRRERYERWMRNPLMRAWTMTMLMLKPSREGRAMRLIRRHAPPGRMLDIGCGDGRLLARAAALGYDITGVEPSPKMASKAARRIGSERVRVGRMDDFEWTDASFDLIVTVSYLEHEPDPLPALATMRRLLKPGGVCAHKTPNYATWLRKLLGKRWSGYRWPEHVQYFTPATLGRLLNAAGFEQVAVQAWSLSDNFWSISRRAAGPNIERPG